MPIVVLLRQRDLRIGSFGPRGGLVERGLDLPHVLLGLRKRSLLLLNDVFVRLRINAKQHIPFLKGSVLLHRYLDHAALHRRQHRCHRKIDARIFRKRMIVVHNQQQQRDADDPTERRGRERPLIDRYPKKLENHVTDRNIDQD